jgi:hypothetical protein
MNKLFVLFFPLFLFAAIVKFPYTVKLKKDQFADFVVYRRLKKTEFKFRWTLYVNDTLTVFSTYDGFTNQYTLFKTPTMNLFRVTLEDFPEPRPYFLIQFVNFNGKIAVFKIFLFNGKNIRVELKGRK